MEIVCEVFPYLETSAILSLGGYHTCHMVIHDGESFGPSWFIISRQETPGITKTSSRNHKTTQVSHLFYTIFIVFAVTISEHGDFHILLEFLNWFPVCISCIFLLIRSSMDGDEFGSSLFERLSELDEFV